MDKTEKLALNTLRMLGVDAINKANSGHPGIVLGAAPTIYGLYTKHLIVNPANPKWINRDRFVLSAGHGSALLYAINHLSRFNVDLADLKNFRQTGNTPGHPEYNHTDGVDATTGPLGQGIANAVGMAIAEAHLAARFNKGRLKLVDHYTYALCGDGDLQEGVAQEAISLAGHLKLNKLIVLFDSNDIQLDGPTSMATSEDHKMRFAAAKWNYILVKKGTDPYATSNAINKAKKSDKPTLIEIKTSIGYGSPLANTEAVHGAPLGETNRADTAKYLGYKHEPFDVDPDVYAHYHKHVYERGLKEYEKWQSMAETYKEKHRPEFEMFERFIKEDYKLQYDDLPTYNIGESIATRQVSGELIKVLSEKYPNLIGGSADLSSSTKAKGVGGDFTKDRPEGRNINYGVREHAMAAINNGIALHGGLRVFSGGFFVFSDYMKPAIRLSAMMKLPVIYIFTHDSVMVGEDGPTHQPIEQLTMLRSIPNLTVFRPADANETVQAWKLAMENLDGPTVLVLTRQSVRNVSAFNRSFKRGAYVVSKEKGKLDGVLLASGSEVPLAIFAQKELENDNIFTRVVSMPSMEMFDKQIDKYKEELLPEDAKILAIELGSPMPWYKYTKHVYGLNDFGISAPKEVVRRELKFEVEDIVEEYKKI
jgi:transketolase